MGNLGIGTTSLPTGGGKPVLAMGQASDNPTGIGSNTAGLVVKDVAGTAELFAWDEGGTVTQISPHDPLTGEWIFYSVNTKTGKALMVDMEKLVKFIDEKFGTDFVKEFTISPTEE